MNFGAALARAMEPDPELARIHRELRDLNFILERRQEDLRNLARMIAMLEEKIRDRQDSLDKLAGR